MNRRSFLAALCAAPLVPKIVDAAETAGASTPDAVKQHLHIADANLGAVQAGALRSKDGRLTIDFSSGAILVMA
ncbi:hypothetical protein phi2LM21_p49 [Sinorhizobium phage phi2LM21]|nr:hypothetical protein phi2LM21_p49 [Sinorhizobium phage phi2LM21]OWZ95144.1 hypothetical protein B9J07_05990 [Sinorhizobium sp. LM21]